MKTTFFRGGAILLFLTACWFGMLAVHELGHIMAACASGAVIEQIIVFPISWTKIRNVEYPLFVYGAGAVAGTMLPLFIWLLARWFRLKTEYLFRFFAGFCLIANGAYIGCDFSTTGPSDAGLLIEYGANRLVLVIFGVFCICVGLFLWHGQSRWFFPER
ncbi:MAG: hypothetical protein FWG73_06665 [Planctomycetaceae bacterium]|nr:hypothetical protein [Planctomycetaceae bacterium]